MQINIADFTNLKSLADIINKAYQEGYTQGLIDSSEKEEIINKKNNISYTQESETDIRIGDIVKFGRYKQNSNKKEPIEWRVLAAENGKALIISQYALNCKKYNKSYEDTSWEKCTLRKWLNNDFLNSAFNPTEQDLIQLSIVTADNNPEYSTNQGNDTEDKVFLLSVKELEKYFKNDEDRKCTPTKLAINNGAYMNDNGQCWWWLRSLGVNSYEASSVITNGSVDFVGNDVDSNNDSVRPAMWVKTEGLASIVQMV